MSVVLPAPFSPTRAWISPSFTTRSTPSSAWRAPKRLRMPGISRSGTRSVPTAFAPAAPAGHTVRERVRDGEREVRAPERREHSGGDHRPVPRLPHRDTDRLGGARVLADSTQAQARHRPKEEDLDEHDEREAGPDDRILVRDDIADERDCGQRSDLDIGDTRKIRWCSGRSVELVVEIAREPERQDVERHP